MAYEVTCSHCSARFSLTADLYARKIKGRISTIRCPRCSKDTTIDDSTGEGRAPPLKPLADVDSSRRPEPISERRISYSDVTRESLEAVVELAAAAPKRLQPPPVPRKTPELAKKALWIVSYAEDDDRELTVLQIRSALVRGEVTRDTLVWQEGMPAWIAMGQVPELAAILPRAGEVLKHRMPSDKSPRRPSSRPPPKPEGPVRMPAIPGSRAMKPPLPTGQGPAEAAAPEPEEKARTRPDLPKPRWRNPPPESAPVTPRDESEPPPSSGSPALRSLTQKASRAATPQSADEALFGMRSADPGLMNWADVDASRLTAPAADGVPAPLEAAPPERRHGRTKPASGALGAEQTGGEDSAPASPRASAPPLIEAADAAEQPARPRSPLLWVVLLAGLMFGVAWLLLRSPWAARARTEEPEAPATAVAAKPEDHAAGEQPGSPTEPSAAPADSTEARDAGAAVPTAPETPEAAEEPRQRAHAPVAAAPERSTAKSATPGDSSKRPAEEPAEPAEPPAAEPSRPAVTAPFDKTAAVSVLNALAGQASACRQGSDPSGIATVVLTFAPSGRVTSATVNGPPFAGTSTGGCVARTLRRAQVPAFNGDHVTVSKSVLVQ